MVKYLNIFLLLFLFCWAGSVHAETLEKAIEPKAEDLIFFKLGETLMAAPKAWVKPARLSGLSPDKKIRNPLKKAVNSSNTLLNPVPLRYLIFRYRPEYKDYKPSDTPYAPYYLEPVPYSIVVNVRRGGGVIQSYKETSQKLQKNEDIQPDEYGYLKLPRVPEASQEYYKKRQTLKWSSAEDNIKQVDCSPHLGWPEDFSQFDCRTRLTWRPFLEKEIFHRIKYEFRRNKFSKRDWEKLDVNVIQFLNQMKLWADKYSQ